MNKVREIKWYYWLAFILGGLAAIAIVYIVLRGTGAIYRLTPRKNRWVEYEE
ncbi:MAG: hypothetical protein JSW34_08215 [Candidatus Zixiibacteriota bacterium]|nr:MAG: hypothetical protein JSW34_08215 [candidate division Zixibacteria bacterium]